MKRRLQQLAGATQEVVLLGLGWTVYQVGRHVVADRRSAAFDNAALVRRLEAALHLPDEASVQAALGSPDLFRLADVYYVSVHFPMAILFLVWGYARRPREEYRWARNLMALQTAAALVLHAAVPLAPPRMFPQWGFVDTMAVYGPSAYAADSGGFANQLAAMPSLHVGWDALICYVVWRTGPRWLGVLAGCYAATTFLVVVVTANHWWVDGIAGIALLALAALVLPAPRPDAPRLEGPQRQPSSGAR